MKIKSINKVGKKEVYDISVEHAEHYVLENGAVTHNTGVMYSSNNVWIIGRAQEKDGKDLVGYNFTINVEKSRFVKEKSKLPFQVKFDGGIDRYSGLLDLAIESGHVIKPSNGRYCRVDKSTGETDEKKYYEKDTHNKEWWAPIFADPTFGEFVRNKYQLAVTSINLDNEEDDES